MKIKNSLFVMIIFSGVFLQAKFDVSFEQSMRFNDIETAKYGLKTSQMQLDNVKKHMHILKNLYEKNSFEKIAPQPTCLIPKIIHQIWVGPRTPPARFEESQRSLKNLHPDWQYKLWTDADIPSFNLINQDLYNQAKNFGAKADILRYEILERFGGFYFDVDFVCLQPLDEWAYRYDFITGIDCAEHPAFLNNAFIACRPGHPILKDCIDTLKHDWTTHAPKKGFAQILFQCGPIHFEKSFFKLAETYEGKVIALPRSYLYPLSSKESKEVQKNVGTLEQYISSETLAIHYWALSWTVASTTN